MQFIKLTDHSGVMVLIPINQIKIVMQDEKQMEIVYRDGSYHIFTKDRMDNLIGKLRALGVSVV